QFIQPVESRLALGVTRNGDNQVVSSAREPDVQQAHTFSCVALCNAPTHSRRLGALPQYRRALRTEGPRPIADPALAQWIGRVKALAVAFRCDAEDIALFVLVQTSQYDNRPLQALGLVVRGQYHRAL